MKVFASSITNLTDARYFAALGADFLGFVLSEHSQSYIEPTAFQSVCAWVEGPKIVGEFFATDWAIVEAAADFYRLDAVVIELDVAQQVEQARPLPAEKSVFLRLNYSDVSEIEKQLQSLRLKPDFFLLNLTGKRDFDQDLVLHAIQTYPVLIHFDGSPEELEWLVSTFEPHGVCFSGGEEERVGVKTFGDLDAYFEVLEQFS